MAQLCKLPEHWELENIRTHALEEIIWVLQKKISQIEEELQHRCSEYHLNTLPTEFEDGPCYDCYDDEYDNDPPSEFYYDDDYDDSNLDWNFATGYF